MWHPIEDHNNPWQPFRKEPSKGNIPTKCHVYSDEAKPAISRKSSNPEDENWNSATVTTKTEKCNKSQNRSHCRSSPQIVDQGKGEVSFSLLDIREVSASDAETENNDAKSLPFNDYVIQMASVQHQGRSACQGRVLDSQPDKNQWSPFLRKSYEVSCDGPEVYFEYREPNGNRSCYSERSSYSTDTDDFTEEDYEIVGNVEEELNNNDNRYRASQRIEYLTGEQFNAPPSPSSLNERYYTAPNSPKSDHDGFCMINLPEDIKGLDSESCSYSCGTVQAYTVDDVGNLSFSRKPNSESKNETKLKDVSNDINTNNVDVDIGAAEMKANSPLDTFTANITTCLEEAMEESKLTETEKNEIKDFNRFSVRNDRSRIPKMELPPFIDVQNIQYEADPKTGAVRTVGKGSFGQVFKARFADPALRHLRIVVKEFNEEYTNRPEILDEAKRLLYLGDTGYVPICYGLVCLGDVDNPTFGLVQEYVGSGLTLEQALWDHYDLEINIWLGIAFQACEGLARFHEKGILLNDIKSNNILLEFFRSMVRIKYIDFGLATDMRGKRYKNTKSLEEFIYLAPEVRKDGCRTNIATDIFSLGFMLEQICTIAEVHELGFMTRLCMDMDPDARLPVRAAANIIFEHMVKFGYDTSILCR